MIIQHNIMAINSHRNLGVNNKNLSGNLEKLSSGYRINRAADDAAGLAISEKMRAQITGLDRAVLNAQDGSSLIQTAEGALTEVHSMLNRMVELATQSANGTIQADDRQKIEAETNALKEEIDRISKATNFNGIKLLDGSLSTSGVTEIKLDNLNTTFVNPVAGSYTYTISGATTLTEGASLNYNIALDDGTSINMNFTVAAGETALIASDGTVHTTITALTSSALTAIVKAELDKNTTFNQKFTTTVTAGALAFTSKEAGTKAPKIAGVSATHTLGATKTNIATTNATVAAADAYKTAELVVFNGTNENSAVFSVNGVKFAMVSDAATLQQMKDKGVNALIGDETNIEDMAALINQKTGLQVGFDDTVGFEMLIFSEMAGSGKGLTMQVGDTAEDFNKITVSVDNMSSIGLGISGISMATQESASAALDAIKAGIEKVSVNRGNLGALQNRLDHTINNLNVTSENMTAAESRIRDVDMAKEMMAFTKNNVLSQAAQAMLAQANMQPQQVLQLLR